MKLSEKKIGVVSSFKAGYRVTKNGKVKSPLGRILKPSLSKNGENLYYDRFSYKNWRIFIHQLVAYQKFGDKWLLSDLVVRHLNGNSLDNSFDNIEIGTRSENALDIPFDKGPRLFTSEQVKEIINLKLIDKKSYREIAKKFSCSHCTIIRIIQGKRYASLTNL